MKTPSVSQIIGKHSDHFANILTLLLFLYFIMIRKGYQYLFLRLFTKINLAEMETLKCNAKSQNICNSFKNLLNSSKPKIDSSFSV